MNLWEIVAFITHLPLEVILFLIITGICEFLPVVLIAYLLKLHMRVGKLDLWMTSLLYVFFVFIFVLIVDAILPDVEFLCFMSFAGGLLISFFFLGPLFNAITLEAEKVYIFDMDLDSMPPNVDLHYCYLYEKGGTQYIVEIDTDGYEPITSFIKRLFNRKTRFIMEGVRLSFTVFGVYTGIFAKSLEYRKIRDENGKTVKALIIDPVESHRFNEVQFITQLTRFKDLMGEINKLYDENTKYERQLHVLARYEARKMVLSLQKAYATKIEEAYKGVKLEIEEELDELGQQIKDEQQKSQPSYEYLDEEEEGEE